jgi:CBS domain-containing protein/ribosome-associated translation inhibitor RaiA
MVKEIAFSPEDMVSKAASRMVREGKRAVLVSNDDEFVGILSAKNMVKKKMDNPDKTKIRQFVDRIDPILSETPTSEVLNSMMINDYSALPVKNSRGEISILTKLGLLKTVRGNPVFKEKTAEDVMNFPYSISATDSLTTARSLMRDLNLSRLPVLGKNNRLEGLVDSMNLLKAIIAKRRAGRGELSGEDIKLDDIKIISFMTRNPAKSDPKQKLSRVIGTMIKNNTPTIMVLEKDEVKGIITPRDILKLIGREVRGTYVTISGLQGESNFIKSLVDEEVSNEIRKIAKFMPVESFILHVDKYHEEGKRVKYSVKGRLITNRGVFSAGDFAWDVTKAMRGVLNKIEREVLKKKDKNKLK